MIRKSLILNVQGKSIYPEGVKNHTTMVQTQLRIVKFNGHCTLRLCPYCLNGITPPCAKYFNLDIAPFP